MTPIQLVQALADRISAITKDLRMEESDGEHVLRAPHVWTQNLPEKLYDDDKPDPADYPLALVMLGGGSGIVDDKMPCDIAILVAGYDDGQPVRGDPHGVRDRQGWMIPAMLVWRILTSLAADRMIGPFEMDKDRLSWELPGQDEQPSPQWFGIIRTVWRVPLPAKDHRLDDTPVVPTPPSPWDEDLEAFMEGK